MKLLNRYKQRGIGLLEILIALAISAIMLLAIGQMYSKFVETSAVQKEQSLAQDQANFAFLALNRAVRMSGAGLCVRPTIKSNTYFHQKTIFDTFPPVMTSKGLVTLSASSRLHSFADPSNSKLGIVDTTLEVNPNSDALLVIYSDSNTRRINAVIEDGSGRKLSPQESSIYNDRRFAEDRKTKDDMIFYNDGAGKILPTWVMVSDCEHTGIYKYTQALFEGKALNILPNPDPDKDEKGPPTSKGFLYNFSGNGQESLAARLYARLFFVAKDSQTGISHLYTRDLLAPNTDPQPIAVYVQSMKVEYLDLTETNSDRWKTTEQREKNIEQSLDWSKNLPVRVSLTMYAGTKNPAPVDDERTYTRILDIRN